MVWNVIVTITVTTRLPVSTGLATNRTRLRRLGIELALP